MKGPLTLMKPWKQRSKSAITQNMFHDPNRIESDNPPQKDNMEHYDIVGPQELRKKLLSKSRDPAKA